MDAASSQVAANIAAIRDTIDDAARAADRDPTDIALVAISKQQPEARVRAALNAGHRRFGENRVQEALARWDPLREEFDGVELRLVGPLQTNKAKDAVAFFDVIETLDRAKLARALVNAGEAAGALPRLYVQVNTGEESQKAGVAPRDADAFVASMRKDYGLAVDGLMCIPPANEEPALHFALLADIAERNGIAHLSMGMSADFETAVRFGATSVRVGSALFGPR